MTHQTIPIYDSGNMRPPAVEEISEVLKYRHLIYQLIRRNITARYKRSFLGVVWSMLKPLGLMLVMVIVFSTIFGREPGYRAYVLSGLVAWSFFAESTTSIMQNLVWGSDLLKRIYVPRSAFALASVGTGYINLLLALVPLLIVSYFVGVKITPAILLLPVNALLIFLFSLGFGLLLSVIAINFADVAEMYQVALRAWMYLTPVIYPASLLINNGYGWLLNLNPMTHLISVFRIPLEEGRIPTFEEYLPGLSISLVTVIIGWIVFTIRSDEFAYRI